MELNQLIGAQPGPVNEFDFGDMDVGLRAPDGKPRLDVGTSARVVQRVSVGVDQEFHGGLVLSRLKVVKEGCHGCLGSR